MSGLRIHRFVGMNESILLRVGDCSTDGFTGSLASLGQSVVSGVKKLPVLRTVICQMHKGSGGEWETDLLHLIQHILVGRELAIQTKELLLLLGHRLENRGQ